MYCNRLSRCVSVLCFTLLLLNVLPVVLAQRSPTLGNLSLHSGFAQQPVAPRKYLIKPLNLGTNTEIRARATRNLQVRVTDENDRPVPDVPILFFLSNSGVGGVNGAGTLAAQVGLRATTNSEGVAEINVTASNPGTSTKIKAQVEGTDAVWEGTLNITNVPLEVAEAASQIGPRKYLIKPLNLGTNTEIRARATRNLQVRVTDENDRPVSDVPLLLFLASGGSGLSSTGVSAAQVGFRLMTNSQGIAEVNVTASNASASARIRFQVEGTEAVWEGTLNVTNAPSGLQELGNEAFDALNEARQNPSAFAAKMEAALKRDAEVEEAVRFLRNVAQQTNHQFALLQREAGLDQAAREHAEDYAKNPGVSHRGSSADCAPVQDWVRCRMERYGAVDGYYAENIWHWTDRKAHTGEETIMEWLLDRGGASRYHRRIMFDSAVLTVTKDDTTRFNAKYLKAGFGCAFDAATGNLIIVLLIADEYTSKPIAAGK
jgi:uncharacterized protein YkwD